MVVDLLEMVGKPPQAGNAAILENGVRDAQVIQGSGCFVAYGRVRCPGRDYGHLSLVIFGHSLAAKAVLERASWSYDALASCGRPCRDTSLARRVKRIGGLPDEKRRKRSMSTFKGLPWQKYGLRQADAASPREIEKARLLFPCIFSMWGIYNAGQFLTSPIIAQNCTIFFFFFTKLRTNQEARDAI